MLLRHIYLYIVYIQSILCTQWMCHEVWNIKADIEARFSILYCGTLSL